MDGVAGPTFGPTLDAANLVDALASSGLQATNLARGAKLLRDHLAARRAQTAAPGSSPRARVVLSYTSNLVSCGCREVIAAMCREGAIDALVTTAGGVEEDIIKCIGDTVVGDFSLGGAALRKEGLNRVGNLLIPNNNYVGFEAFYVPLLKEMHKAQASSMWAAGPLTPSEHIQFVGERLGSIGDAARLESSVVHCASARAIPIFCPALTDGSMGDMIFFYNFGNPGLVVDPLPDVARLSGTVSPEDDLLIICLGGGLPKHFLLRAFGAHRKQVIMVTTGSEWDGCTSSCTPADDHSAGLLTANDVLVRIQGDAAAIFPLMVAVAL